MEGLPPRPESEMSDCGTSTSVAKKSQSVSMDDDMTRLVNLQSSGGVFIQCEENWWNEGVFIKYLGSFQDVMASCPYYTDINTWLTALAMKILEVYMTEKKELWELVAEKSNKYLLNQLLNNNELYNELQKKAEDFVLKQKNN